MTVSIGPGASFAGYRVESVIGRGGMGVVYRATDLSLERPVALKLIAPELAGDERFRGRFLKEPKLAASLDHPNVVPIYEAGEEDGQLYLAMRFVEGSDLKTAFEHRLVPDRLLGILAQIAGALDAAHRRGLVHRDVKPANVLLDEDDHAYLTDFGITKQVGGDSTQPGQLVGTLDYIAPEQIRGDPVDGRTDCYSLACVLYEGLTGTPPFRRQSEPETLWAHMQEQPPPLPDPALDAVLQRALAKERDERYPTCTQLIQDTRAALGLSTPGPSPLCSPRTAAPPPRDPRRRAAHPDRRGRRRDRGPDLRRRRPDAAGAARAGIGGERRSRERAHPRLGRAAGWARAPGGRRRPGVGGRAGLAVRHRPRRPPS